MKTRTQNDVDGNEVRLDYESLVKVTEICFGLTMQEIRRHLSNLTYPNEPSPSLMQLETQRLAEHAHRLALTGEVLSALRHGKARDTVTIINRERIED